ncbi:MAG: hypothetical protein PHH98_01665 [Candidatus Gracilibacteria bacterium]|nr:hypothetical protein [Candidatus Gracilibacteria bacterium]
MNTIETKINTQSGIEKNKNLANTTREEFKKTLLSIVEQKEIGNTKLAERAKIKEQTGVELLPLVENTHLMVENELAKLFGLSGVERKKLELDFKEQPTTLAGVLAGGEQFWEAEHLLAA